jgi:hypothetical protein
MRPFRNRFHFGCFVGLYTFACMWTVYIRGGIIA